MFHTKFIYAIYWHLALNENKSAVLMANVSVEAFLSAITMARWEQIAIINAKRVDMDIYKCTKLKSLNITDPSDLLRNKRGLSVGSLERITLMTVLISLQFSSVDTGALAAAQGYFHFSKRLLGPELTQATSH